jgi:ribosomal protein L14E/L6E/L27E
MTIYDLIEEVKHSRNKVIPTEYILKRLREVASHEKGFSKQLFPNIVTSNTIDSDEFKDMKLVKGSS